MDNKSCNHHHPLTKNHVLVDFGDGKFVANKDGVPLLKALNKIGLKTRTHHIDKKLENCFISLLIPATTHIEIRQVHEKDSTRTKYNGMTEALIVWKPK